MGFLKHLEVPNDFSEVNVIVEKVASPLRGGARSSRKVTSLSHNSTPLRPIWQFSFHLGKWRSDKLKRGSFHRFSWGRRQEFGVNHDNSYLISESFDLSGIISAKFSTPLRPLGQVIISVDRY